MTVKTVTRHLKSVLKRAEDWDCTSKSEDKAIAEAINLLSPRALKNRFPWLGTDDDANGADVVDVINEWYSEIGGK